MIPRSQSNAAWLVPGSRLDRYDLLLPIAEGGMAVLWLARQQGKHGFDKVVAIKTILPKLATEPGFQKMFLDEARVAARIEHINVAQVLDLGEENGVLFMAMEWVDSESLINLGRAVARAKNPTIPIGILARIMADACAGLHAAHELKDEEGRPLNVVHRDVSPHNLLISFRGITKVIDFGIAKARNRLSHDTNVGTVKGKIAYMAPEQAMGGEVDRRADVWGAGATLYRFLAGRAPYSAANPIATLRLLTSGQPPPALPTSIPKAIRHVVEKSLELDVDKRFRTVEEMRLALEEAMRAANLQTTQADVEGFVNEHLGEARALRGREIDAAVRESRSRTRATTRMSPSVAELKLGQRSDRPPSMEPPPSDVDDEDPDSLDSAEPVSADSANTDAPARAAASDPPASSVPAVSSIAPPTDDDTPGKLDAATRAFSHKRIRSVHPTVSAHETPTSGPPSAPNRPLTDDEFDRRRTVKMRAKAPTLPEEGSPQGLPSIKSGAALPLPSVKSAAALPALPSMRQLAAPSGSPSIKTAAASGGSPSMRRLMPTPLAMQVAPLSLRTSVPSKKAEAALSPELATKLARPPTPAWIRVQPGLGDSGFPEQTPPSGSDSLDAQQKLQAERDAAHASSDPLLDPNSNAIESANTATASWLPMRVRQRANRVATVKIHAVRGATGVLVLGAVVVGLQLWTRASPVATSNVTAPAPTVSAAPPTAASLIDRALHASEIGETPEAKRLLAAAIAEEPTNADAIAALAEIERNEGATTEAIADYRRAIAASPEHLPARLGLADVLWMNGQRDEAQALYRGIVASAPAAATPDRARARAR